MDKSIEHFTALFKHVLSSLDYKTYLSSQGTYVLEIPMPSTTNKEEIGIPSKLYDYMLVEVLFSSNRIILYFK